MGSSMRNGEEKRGQASFLRAVEETHGATKTRSHEDTEWDVGDSDLDSVSPCLCKITTWVLGERNGAYVFA